MGSSSVLTKSNPVGESRNKMVEITNQDDCTKQLCYIKVQHALAAIRCYTLERLAELHSEMDSYMEVKKKTAAELTSRLTSINPVVGMELPMEQFEEYVQLQRQLVDTLRKVPATKARISDVFNTMLEDTRKLYIPARYSSFVAKLLKPVETKNEEAKSERLLVCAKGEHAFQAIHWYFLERITRLNLELEEKKAAAEENMEKIVGLNPRSGNVLTMEQFEEYVALQRSLFLELGELLGTVARIRQEVDAVLDNNKKLLVFSKFSRFITEPSQSPQVEDEVVCSKVCKVASYIFILASFFASMFVF